MQSTTELRAAPSPPNAGRSLGILIGVAAVLWLWTQLPAWYQSGHAAPDALGAWLRRAVYNEWVGLALVLAANAVVARGTTRPMRRLAARLEVGGLKGVVVLGLAGLFHLVVGGFGLLLLGLLVLDGPSAQPTPTF